MLKEVSRLYSKSRLEFAAFTFILLTLLVLRFLWLDRFPVGISHDDAEVLLSAKTYYLFGTDISNTPFPLSIFTNSTEGGLAGLPSAILSVFIGGLSFSLSLVRIPYVIVNVATVIFLGLLVHQFTKNKLLSVITVLVGLINPWLFIYSRSPTEAPFALFFILLGLNLFFTSNGKWMIWSSIPFVLAFFSYFGAKPLIPVLIIVLVVNHSLFIKKKPLRKYLAFIGVVFLCIGIYFLLLFNSNKTTTFGNRAGKELVFNNLDRFEEAVNEQRRASIDFPYKNLVYNKYTGLSKEIAQKVMGALSPDLLFFGGDTPSIYRLGEHGLFYLFDAVFIFFGVAATAIVWYKKQRQIVFLTLSSIAVALIPSIVSKIGTSYFFRGFFLIPWLIVLISFGIYQLMPKGQMWKRNAYIVVISVIYLISFGNFLTFFFFRYSVREQENHFLSGRILASYLSRSDSNIFVVTTSPHAAYHQYLFYASFPENHKVLSQVDSYQVANIEFVSDCNSLPSNKIIVLDSRVDCKNKPKGEHLGIYNQKDAGLQFWIFGDTLCKDIQLDSWRRFHYISDYDVEGMSDSQFCQRWLQKM